jgi:hypothetical protein
MAMIKEAHKMIVLTEHEKKVLSIFTIAAVIFVYYKFLEQPCINNLKALSVKIEEESLKLKGLENYEEDMKAIDKRILLLKEASDIVPDNLNLGNVLTSLKDMINQSGCIIGNIVIKDGYDENFENVTSDIALIKTAGITCSLYGDYMAIGRMIKSIENSGIKMTVESIDLNMRTETKDYFAVLEINCYYIDCEDKITK